VILPGRSRKPGAEKTQSFPSFGIGYCIMIVPWVADERLLADIESARRDTTRVHLWWLGQSGFLIQWQGQHLLLDPYLSDSLTAKYAQTDKPHVRMTERVIDPGRLTMVDVVTCSHHHTDHLDGETLQALLQANPRLEIVVPAAHRELAASRVQCRPERLSVIDDEQSLTAGGFQIHAIPSAHETVERDERGQCKYLGYVVEFGGIAIYHSGDTVRYDGLVERLWKWNLDLALLPINGAFPERRVAGNLGGREAAQLAHDARVTLAIPCHYEMFEFNTASTGEFEAACQEIGQRYRILRAGERLSFPE
jgi:L-ascorbate metabolism protein UlaG (beta-lactamase superfamily)